MEPLSPPEQMSRLLTGYWLTQALHVAARLGLADLLKDRARTAAALAQATGTHAPSLYRLLRGLASVGVFAEGESQEFSLTPLAACLRSDVAGSQHALALMVGEDQYRAWGELLYSVQTGQPGFDKLHGMPLFDYLSREPEKAKVFDAAMVGVHGRETAAMLDVFDFSEVPVLADIGGGNASLLTAVLQRYPAMRGILYDLPGAAARAQLNLEAAGLAERCQAIGGNFFESVPAGADAYLLRHIIHDWNDEQSLQILRNIHRVIGPNGKLLLVEGVVPPGNGPSFTKLLDLAMLVVPGGKERTELEYRQLLQAAGFELSRLVPTKAEVSVLEGKKR